MRWANSRNNFHDELRHNLRNYLLTSQIVEHEGVAVELEGTFQLGPLDLFEVLLDNDEVVVVQHVAKLVCCSSHLASIGIRKQHSLVVDLQVVLEE